MQESRRKQFCFSQKRETSASAILQSASFPYPQRIKKHKHQAHTRHNTYTISIKNSNIRTFTVCCSFMFGHVLFFLNFKQASKEKPKQ